jgi:hypothetical protein
MATTNILYNRIEACMAGEQACVRASPEDCETIMAWIKRRAQKVGMGNKPDPTNFTIKKIITGDRSTLVLANYPGRTQFGGDKLVLFYGVIPEFKTLDPHFFEDYDLVARFAPTQLGWKLAEEAQGIVDATGDYDQG